MLKTASLEGRLTKVMFPTWFAFKLQVKMQGHFCFINWPVFVSFPDIDMSSTYCMNGKACWCRFNSLAFCLHPKSALFCLCTQCFKFVALTSFDSFQKEQVLYHKCPFKWPQSLLLKDGSDQSWKFLKQHIPWLILKLRLVVPTDGSSSYTWVADLCKGMGQFCKFWWGGGSNFF